jgi:hypothetical protein
VLLPAPPARSSPASASPPATCGRSRNAKQGMEAVGFLPGGRRVLLLAMSDAGRRVEVDPQLTARLRGPPRQPRPAPDRSEAASPSDPMNVTPDPPGARPAVRSTRTGWLARHNTQIWTASVLMSIKPTSAQNSGGYRTTPRVGKMSPVMNVAHSA